MEPQYVSLLLKFSNNKKRLFDFVKKGHIYMNHYSYFSYECNKHGQADKNEFLTEITHLRQLSIHGQSYTPLGSYQIRSTDQDYSHIFCMTAIHENEIRRIGSHYIFHPEIWDSFGEYLVVIHNVKKFQQRLFNHKEVSKYRPASSLIEYIPDDYVGEVGPFRKFDRFQYQSEYRFAIDWEGKVNKQNAIDHIYLGDLSDIASIPIHKKKVVNKIIEGKAIFSL